MRLSRVRGLIVVVGMILMLPAMAYAQGATLAGTAKDASGAVLPGVTITAKNTATGNVFENVTDGTGSYHMLVRPGIYDVTAELAGFQTVVRSGREVLIGQTLTVSFELAISTLQETVTVTGEQPLLDVATSSVSGNIDPRQMEALPINGRNWMNLTLLAPGSRQNAAAEVPQDRQGYFQMIVDGQQITQLICCSGRQPRYSREAIAEFELMTNRFDASVGRSEGMVVNAITKSGTNKFSGLLAGYFRDSSMMAADPVAGRVLPFQEQQLTATFGGPIRQDRIHFFGNYEYDRSPFTVAFNSVFPALNGDVAAKDSLQTGGGRLDFEISPATRLSVRVMKYKQLEPFNGTGGATSGASTGETLDRSTNQAFANFTQILGATTTNEIKAGYQAFNWKNLPDVKWNGSVTGFPTDPIVGVYPGAAPALNMGSALLQWSNYTIGTANNSPQDITEHMIQVRDDLTASYDKGGRHDVKLGGEYIRNWGTWEWCNVCGGTMRFFGNAPANLPDFIGDPLDAATWNLAGLAPFVRVRDFSQSIGDFHLATTRDIFAFWLQDDWSIGDNLTLNLGVRYDLDIGVQGERFDLDPWVRHPPSDTNNIAPRLGGVYRVNDKTVFRFGYGIYFTQLENDGAHQTQLFTKTTGVVLKPDGRADFLVDPWNGPIANYDSVTFCDKEPVNSPGCLPRNINIEVPAPNHQISYSHQAMVGIERQLNDQSVLTVNYTFTGGRGDEADHNVQLSFDPVTGISIDPTPIANRQFPGWGPIIGLEFMESKTNYHGMDVSFRRRMANRWQLSATYTLSGFWDWKAPPQRISLPGPTESPISGKIATIYGGLETLAAGDQRHRATANAIWDLGAGFQLSGVYFFGSGERFFTIYANGACGPGTTSYCGSGRGEEARLRPDGTLVPRNAFVGKPIHRLDLRLTKQQKIGGASVSGIFEVFNVFNHKNYGSYTLNESSASYGNPRQNRNTSYLPTTVQLGFRVSF